MIELPLREPRTPRYLYIGPDNTLHVFVPIVGGTSIGTDNTCKAVYSLQEFFGKGSNSNLKTTLKGELLAYQEALEYDLSLLEALTPLAQQKTERLMQIKAYLEVLGHLEQHEELNCLNSGFPSYPRPLELMMQSRKRANVYSMILRPTEEDGYLRLEAANPVFSVAHKSVVQNIMTTTASPLQEALIQAYSPLNLEAKGLKFQAMREAMVESGSSRTPVDFERLRNAFQERLRALMHDESIDLTHTPDKKPIPVDQAYIDTTLVYDAQTTTPKAYMNALLGFCVPHLFATILESPFDTLENAERWSVATQFLLGLINIHGVAQGHLNPETNWGRILDEHPDLSQSLAQTLAEAQKTKDYSIESACLAWINAYFHELKLNKSFTPTDIELIKKEFATLYAQIEYSSHFDEFLIFRSDRKGDFFTHQFSICTSFATFACHSLLGLSKEVTQLLERAQAALATLDTQIPYNPIPEEKITLDVSQMPLSELHTLYKRITTYKDPKVKEQLQSQLKQERPDFKPKIDARQFLQCVAFGQQNEAEVLLKEDADKAQELLLADNMSFTDYSGRTFTCTAYEYAYWAKDTHMCRMLEKYMNNDAKYNLLQRVQRIEELVGEGLFKAPRGLAYMQNGEEHCCAHFDLTPLKQGLKTYIDAYDNSPKQTDAEWEALESLWVEVGLLQRDVPAHIAQEYCHPNRSFEDVVKEAETQKSTLLDAADPNNLVRQLNFYNWGTDADDSWFTPDSYSSNSGLGFSFAILRGTGDYEWAGAVCPCPGRVCSLVDLAAIEAIDKARTDDLKQSLANLVAPSSLLLDPFSAN